MYDTHMMINESTPPLRPSDALFDEATERLFQLGRSFARLPLPISEDDTDGTGASRTLIQVCLAIVRGQDAGTEITVAWVGRELGIEASTASRLVAQAAEATLVQRAPSPADRRRVVLDLTGAGIRLAQSAIQYQRQVFDELTGSWDPTEREIFARLFIQFANGVIQRARLESVGLPEG